ncbi:MAG TPA: M20/M25/M40 family metallo-hydrolase [Thermoanaerobaculia bacterium]|nr:M20/M25/M40 family metallo-hydrolase [Thermoanaerobaculia bacterium]
MKVFAVIVLILVIALAATWAVVRILYGTSCRGPLPPLTLPQTVLAGELRREVGALAGLGPRSTVFPEALHGGANHVARELGAAGYAVTRQAFETEGIVCENIEAELRGAAKADEIVVIGAHYDSVDEAPGADDNASGVAAMLALARRLAKERPARTIRFVAFVNEEPPNFQTRTMGSWQYARRSRQRGEKIVAMLSLEAIGYYSDERGSQQYPPPLNVLYPDRGNFIGFVANTGSRGLLRRALGAFRKNARFPSQGAALPPVIPQAGWSDQWSFWQFGYPALMVTDTAVFRNPHYHRPTDTPETLDYERTARVVDGLLAVVRELAR